MKDKEGSKEKQKEIVGDYEDMENSKQPKPVKPSEETESNESECRKER